MNKRLLWSCSTLLLFVLSGCDQNFSLVSDDAVNTPGILTIHAMPPHDITLSVHDEDFKGHWKASVVDESARIRQSYGAGSKTYQQYVAGLGDHYLRHGHASLQGAKGTAMECDFDYRGKGNGAGSCVDSNGEKYKMIL